MGARKTSPCVYLCERFSNFIDGRLQPHQEEALRAHLDNCEPCLRHLRAYRLGIGVYRTIESPAPFEFFERIQGRLDDLESPRFLVVPGVRTRRSGAPSNRSGLVRLATAAAAAIAFLLAVSQGHDDALSPEPMVSGVTGVSIASVIPTLSSTALISSTRRTARRAREVARPGSVERQREEPSTWQIAEVEPRFVRLRPRIVQAALTLP